MHLSGGPDRRLSSRYNVVIPFHYRGLKSEAPEDSAESINISERGLYFETDLAPMVDTDLQVRLTMPQEITGKLASEWNCIGHVVRQGPGMYNADRFGVAVCLDFIESLKNADVGSDLKNRGRRSGDRVGKVH